MQKVTDNAHIPRSALPASTGKLEQVSCGPNVHINSFLTYANPQIMEKVHGGIKGWSPVRVNAPCVPAVGEPGSGPRN